MTTKTPRPTTVRRDCLTISGQRPTFERVAAVHEAGHVIVSWLSQVVRDVAFCDISLLRQVGMGVTAIEFACTNSIYDHLEVTTIYLGGIAGEAVANRRFRSSSSEKDLKMAKWMAERAADRMIRPVSDYFQPDSLAASNLDLGLMFRPPPDLDVRETLNLCFRRAKYLVSLSLPAFERLCAALERDKRIDKQGLTALIGPRIFGRR